MAFPSSVPCFEHSDGPPVPYAGENVVLGMMEGMQALHGLHRDVEELGARLEELQQNGAARADIEASVGTATRFGADVEPPRVGARVAARCRARGATLARVRSVACVHTVSCYI